MTPSRIQLCDHDRRGATLSSCGAYRYLLWRSWGEGPRLLWIMLNPSEADADHDDPTLRRCIAFSKAWGFGGLEVVNLYAYRSPDPGRLLTRHMVDTVGPRNSHHIKDAIGRAGAVLCAWGSHKAVAARRDEVRTFLQGVSVQALHINKDGNPKHPLYCRRDTRPIPFTP